VTEKDTHMHARMKNPAMILTDAMNALQALGGAVAKAGVPHKTLELVHMRASQINGCSVCVDGHARLLTKAGEPIEKIIAIAAWRDAPYFEPHERAALALTESLTRIADKEDAVPDTVWNEAAKHYDERALAALVLAIAQINVWNRLNVATRQLAGEWKP
jgi:AhpD family alkylhydroperoxidase